MTLQTAVRPIVTQTKTLWMEVLAFTCVMLLFAPVRIYLPWTPIPIVFQNSLMLFLALFVTPRAVTLSWLSLTLVALAGFPAWGGSWTGLSLCTTPILGYIFGYWIAAYWISASKDRFSPLISLLLGGALILFCGSTYLSCFVGWEKALLIGVAPFVVTDCAKICLLAGICPRIKQAIERAGSCIRR